jgi:hypothetical protein
MLPQGPRPFNTFGQHSNYGIAEADVEHDDDEEGETDSQLTR